MLKYDAKSHIFIIAFDTSLQALILYANPQSNIPVHVGNVCMCPLCV